MQAYDLIMLIVLGVATLLGAIKGFAWQMASIASIVVSYLVAVNFRFDLAKMIQAAPPWNVFLAMLILYVGTSFVIWVAFRLLSGAIDQVRLKEFDRHLGALFGLGKGALYCLLITMFAMTLLGPKQQAAICQSKSGYYIASALDNARGVLPKELHDVVGPYLDQLDQKLHQQYPAGQSPNPNSGSIWPSNWAGGAGAGNAAGSSAGASSLPNLGLPGFGSGFGGASFGSGSGNGTNAEQGAGGDWNQFWPGGVPPQAPAQTQPQNYPPLNLPPPPQTNSFGYDNDPSAAPSLLPPASLAPGALAPGAPYQQAQQPGGYWPR